MMSSYLEDEMRGVSGGVFGAWEKKEDGDSNPNWNWGDKRSGWAAFK